MEARKAAKSNRKAGQKGRIASFFREKVADFARFSSSRVLLLYFVSDRFEETFVESVGE
jgi:hypothetical protein